MFIHSLTLTVPSVNLQEWSCMCVNLCFSHIIFHAVPSTSVYLSKATVLLSSSWDSRNDQHLLTLLNNQLDCEAVMFFITVVFCCFVLFSFFFPLETLVFLWTLPFSCFAVCRSMSMFDMRCEEEAILQPHSQSRHELMHNQYNKMKEEEDHWQDVSAWTCPTHHHNPIGTYCMTRPLCKLHMAMSERASYITTTPYTHTARWDLCAHPTWQCLNMPHMTRILFTQHILRPYITRPTIHVPHDKMPERPPHDKSSYTLHKTSLFPCPTHSTHPTHQEWSRSWSCHCLWDENKPSLAEEWRGCACTSLNNGW